MKSTTPTGLGSSLAIPFLYSNIAIPVLILFLSSLLFKRIRTGFSNQTTPLSGPANTSFLFGLYKDIIQSDDRGLIYEQWALRYGPAFRVPVGLGSNRIAICDPKASAHFHSKETFGYLQIKFVRLWIERQSGRNLLCVEGETHRKQRKVLSPAFSNTTMRKLTPVFYDIAYKMKSMWDSSLDAGHGQAVIDVQLWMGRISLDSIGIAGFGYDFRALEGHRTPVIEVLEASHSGEVSFLSKVILLLGPVLPILLKLPTEQSRMMKRMKTTLRVIVTEMLARNRKEMEATEEKSIIGQLIKVETTGPSLVMSEEEVLAQMHLLLIAGFETTSLSLTWALIELARNPQKQQRLRDELHQYTRSDPTFDQLSTSLPYLDAVTHEVLRLYPPVGDITRIAAEDDIMPFSQPITTASGEKVSSLVIKKGTVVTASVAYMNRAEAFWGPNAKEFVPERWLGDNPCPGAREIQGHKHILTFSDGPRICLGRSFALAEFKSYTFDLPDGPSTVIEKLPSVVPRPKVAGQIGDKVPMIIRRVE